MRHPDEGTLHAFIDGELPAAEAAALEQHVAGCARCAAALAEARGLVAGASRVVTALDAAPASARPVGASASRAVPPAPGRARPRVFGAPVARAAALLLLAGGTAVVLDRAGAPEGRTIPLSESIAAEAPAPARVDSASAVIPVPPVASSPDRAATELTASAGAAKLRRPEARTVAPQIAPIPQLPRAVVAPTEPSRGVAGGTAKPSTSGMASGAVFRTTVEDSAREARVGRATAQTRRREPDTASALAFAEAAPPAPAPPPPPRPASPPPSPPPPPPRPASPPPPPPPPPQRTEAAAAARTAPGEAAVTAVASPVTRRVTRYRLENGTIVTLTEEPLRFRVAEAPAIGSRRESTRAAQAAEDRRAAPERSVNSYSWSSLERGSMYTLSGSLTVAELEAVARRLSELERVP